ncbi:MAG: response regulator transcription factor [Candidatus Eremiobacterota bacterium]
MSVRVLITDDHVLVRQGLKLLLGQDPELEIVGEAGNGQEALEKVAELKPQVVLMDLLMPVMDGLTAIEEMRKQHPEVEIIALTSVLEDVSVVQAIRLGAIGYMLKDTQAVDLCRAIKAAAQGSVQLSPEAAARLVRELRPEPRAPEALTERETDVLKLVAEGRSNQQIAERLMIGESTVKTHVSRLLAKLGVKSRTQIAVHAWQAGLIPKP